MIVAARAKRKNETGAIAIIVTLICMNRSLSCTPEEVNTSALLLE